MAPSAFLAAKYRHEKVHRAVADRRHTHGQLMPKVIASRVVRAVLASPDVPAKELSAKYGISLASVTRIRRRRHRAKKTAPPPPPFQQISLPEPTEFRRLRCSCCRKEFAGPKTFGNHTCRRLQQYQAAHPEWFTGRSVRIVWDAERIGVRQIVPC